MAIKPNNISHAVFNNNPGNIKHSVGGKELDYLKVLDKLGIKYSKGSEAADGGYFIKFESHADGYKAAENWWPTVKSWSAYEGLTLDQALEKYSGEGYSSEKLAIDLDGSKLLSDFTNEELGGVMTSQIKMEDPKEYKILQDEGLITENIITKEEAKKKSEKPTRQSQIVEGPNGEMIEIEIGSDVTESDIRDKQTGGEQRYKSWKELEDNISKLDKSRPFYIVENRYKWNEEKKKALLVDEKGEYLPNEQQLKNEQFQEIFQGPRIETPGGTTEGESPKEIVEEKIITPPVVAKEEKEEKYSPLEKGMYQDDEGNIWRKGDEGGWQVKYNRAAKGTPEVNEYGEPSFEMKFKYDKDWTTLNKDDNFTDPWTNTEQFESQLTTYSKGVYKGDTSDLPSTTTEEGAPVTRGEQLMKGGASLLKGAQAALDYIGGPGAIVSYIMGKKGLKAAMKEIEPQKRAELSPVFMQHLRQSRELSKKGFHPDQARKIRKEMDGAYQIGLENAVRGSGGDRAKYLAQSGVLDAQRSSALLDYAVEDEKLQTKNADKYEKLMLFKENFDIERTEEDRAEDMARQVADKKAAAGFTSAAFTNLISGFGGSSSLTNQYSPANQLYSQMQNMFTKPKGTKE